MWRSDLYAIDTSGSACPVIRLPIYIEPRGGEALCSWLIRLGERLGMTPLDAARCAFGIDGCRRPEWWRRPTATELAAIANKSGLALRRVRAMTLSGWAEARADERHERFGAPGFWRQRSRAATVRPLAMCIQCLADDDEPFIRTDWMIGWIAVCTTHRTILATHCPACGASLSLPGLDARRAVKVGRCSRCDRLLDQSGMKPTLGAVCEVQERLLALKRVGASDLPGIGRIEWGTFVGLVDLVLSALWRPRASHARERLFARVVCDIGLDSESRLHIDWPSNHGAMLILAWLLADWPKRMTIAMDLLRAPRLDELIALVTQVGGAPDGRMEAMLADVVPDRPRIEEEWRRWLESLPETSEMLRQRSRREFRQGVSERLGVLADLRDGMAVAAVAERAKLRAVTVEHWLNIGIEYGLDALTAEQMRISFLTDDQRREIATWLASVSRLSKGPNAWRAEHAQQEIAVRFGVLISAAAVLHLFRSAPWLHSDGTHFNTSSSSHFKERVQV